MSEEASAFSFVAAVKGAAVGAVASLIESTVLGLYFMSGTPHSEAEVEAMAKALVTSQNYLLTDLAASLLCMAVGGYVAGRCAGRSGATHGAVAGALLILFVGVTFLMNPVPLPLWYTAAVFTLIIPASAAGGVLGA